MNCVAGWTPASQYKDYLLVLPFVKYVSDKYTGDKMNKIIGRLADANDTVMISLR